jgi:nitrilase
MATTDRLRVSLAQIAPVWLDRAGTLARVITRIEEAATAGSQLVAFGEGLVPGYPFWPERTGGAVFDSPVQKEFHARYLDQAVQIEAGHLDAVTACAAKHGIAVYLGIIERPADRGGHSLYASMVYISADGAIGSVHRKLMPTYDERLTWSPGDGHGLRTHPLGAFTVGGLNCWENWMPLPRAALYALGEDLHVAIWPGSRRNTEDITRFIACESRSYVLSVSGLMHADMLPAGIPHEDLMRQHSAGWLTDGGSCLAAPDGTWIIEPVTERELVETATIDHARVREERQNFDPAGHYSRPDVTRLIVNRDRQSTASFSD